MLILRRLQVDLQLTQKLIQLREIINWVRTRVSK